MMRPLARGLCALALVAVLLAPRRGRSPSRGPATRTPIQHFVVLMQDNHTFDNYFGTYPGADGIPAGTCMPVELDAARHRASSRSGSATTSPPTSARAAASRRASTRRPDGRFRRGATAGTGSTAHGMGYYDGRDIPYYWNVADQYVLFDRFFALDGRRQRREPHVLGGWDAPATPDDPADSAGFDQLPTIFDRLAGKGISGKFYVQNYDPGSTSAPRRRGRPLPASSSGCRC